MATDPIGHVIVLMLENHSFDQMLGGFQTVFSDLEGVDPAHPRSNPDKDGKPYWQAPTTASSVAPDPMHELANVLRQLENDNANFVLDYAESYPNATSDELQQIMGYYAPGGLPVLHELARHFTICHRWYSSVPGPTWANRFFVHSGTSLGRVQMPEDLADSVHHPDLYFGYDQDTIFDRLNEQGISWRVYHGDIPQSLVLSHQRRPENARRYARLDLFYQDAAGPEAAFPAYSFIEPSYYWPGQNDDHPPHTVLRAQALLGNVYNALRQNDALWNTTLLVVVYDEHGGFYDHVPPPTAVPPDDHVLPNFGFDRYGVRVPAVLVSPWVDRTILSTELDHTSLLQYLTQKWNLGPLTGRVAKAQHFASAIRGTGDPRTDVPGSVSIPALAPAPRPTMAAGPGEPLNAHQKALVAFSEHLEREIEEPIGKPARTAAMMAGPVSQVETAKSRVELFLTQQKAKAGGTR
ncbi:MAG TPA: alkaline phosphatase family protein [Gemmataceae bacterium]|nr:alkaline phosphatase family protein [Gemmataceae bacterium]